MLIILLGEVVVEAGQASVAGHVATVAGWFALVAAMIPAAALWWLYFDSAAELNLRVLELSGGSPTMARAIFAVGLACVGVGIYMAGTRAFLRRSPRVSGLVRALVLVATFFLGRLHDVLSPHAYLWLLAVWVALCATVTTRASGDEDLERVLERAGEHDDRDPLARPGASSATSGGARPGG